MSLSCLLLATAFSAARALVPWTVSVAGTANVTGDANTPPFNASSFNLPSGAAEVITSSSNSTFTAVIVDRGNHQLRGQSFSLAAPSVTYAPSSKVLTIAG